MAIHILKHPSPADDKHPDDVTMWCGELGWKYSRYSHVFMISNWINKPNGVDICKGCWKALHERIGEND